MNTLSDIISKQEVSINDLRNLLSTKVSQNSRLKSIISEIQPYVFEPEVATDGNMNKGDVAPSPLGYLNTISENNYIINSLVRKLEDEVKYNEHLIDKLVQTTTNTDQTPKVVSSMNSGFNKVSY